MTARNDEKRGALPTIFRQLTRGQLTTIAKREKRITSFHEAGHHVVFFRFGGFGDARIWRNTPEGIRSGQCAWLGKFEMYCMPGTMPLDEEIKDKWGIVRPPKNWRVLVGMAGKVAEIIADGVRDPELVAYYFEDAICLGEFSQTDREWMGDAYQQKDIIKVAQLLLDLWPSVEEKARCLRLT